MDREGLIRGVLSALQGVAVPSGGDVVSAGLVQNVEVGDGGDLRFSFTLRSEDPGTLVRAVRKAAEGV